MRPRLCRDCAPSSIPLNPVRPMSMRDFYSRTSFANKSPSINIFAHLRYSLLLGRGDGYDPDDQVALPAFFLVSFFSWCSGSWESLRREGYGSSVSKELTFSLSCWFSTCNSLRCCSSCSIFKPNCTTNFLTLIGVFSQSGASIAAISSRCFSSMPLRLPDFLPPLNGYDNLMVLPRNYK